MRKSASEKRDLVLCLREGEMDRSDDTTSLGRYGGREVGAGGKFRKPPARKPPSTPYDRPPASKQTIHRREGGGGWFSKIVDPAYRLISGGSTRFLPSFFSKSPSDNATPSSDVHDHESDQDTSGDDLEGNSNLGFQSSEVGGPSRAEDEPRCEAEFDEQRQDRKVSLSDDNGLSEIEQLLKGKSLSRDEINRLTVILNSKATGLSNVEQGKKNYSMTAEGEAVGSLVAHKTPRTSTEEKLEGSNKAIWATSTPLPPSTQIRDVVGASPVEIARAYMGSRTSEMGLNSRSLISKEERASADEFASNPSIPLPSPKPICWPGAIVQDQRGYMTPQNERGKLGLHSFPRTPYSRTIFSKSKSKLAQLQGDSNRCLNTSPTPFQQFRTPSYEEVRSRGDDYGSVGPIRRIRHKVVEGTPSRGSVALHSSVNNPSNVDKPVYVGFSPAFKNLETGMTSSTSKFPSVEIKPHSYELGHTTVPQQSSQIARKILEHIDRKIPTLAEKSAEIKLAIASKRPSSSEVTTPMLKEDSSLPTVDAFDSRKNMNIVRQTLSAQGNEYAANLLFKAQPEERSAREVNEEGGQNTSASNLKFRNAGGNAGPSFDFSKNSDSQIKSMHEKASLGFNNFGVKENSELQPLHSYMNGNGVSKTVPNATGSDVLHLQKPRSHSSGKKPVLPFITINKPGLGTVSLSSGFTFPVSASSGALSEPPTPSIMPSSSSAIDLHQTEGAAIPTYTFGSKRSAPPLVFSFPSTSSASALSEASEIKFTFGSDNKSRLSFSSAGKDAICF